MEITIGNKYKLGRRIGEGSFGQVYIATNSETNEEVAVKLEHISQTKKKKLDFEYKCLKHLQNNSMMPKVMYYGQEGEYHVLVMELLGPSLEDLFTFCQKKFSLKTGCLLADQMISCIEHIHENDIVHRDIKPTNVVMGLGVRYNVVNIIDFGLAKRLTNSKTSKHISFRDDHKHLVGTPLFASINAHHGIEISRRDDLESILYCLIYLIKGELPWSKKCNSATTEESRLEEVKIIKLSTPVEQLCYTLPPEFRTFLNYCRSLQFKDRPNYAYLRQLIKDLCKKQRFSADYEFDWNAKRDLFSKFI